MSTVVSAYFGCALTAGLLFSACGSTSTPPASGGTAAKPGGKRYQIAVIPKGTTHSFWNTIHAGALKAERELQAQADLSGGQHKADGAAR